MTPQCQPTQADLKAYHDRELPLLRQLGVRRHLAQCAACREELKIMEQIGQRLQAQETLTEPKLNPALREKILTALPTEMPTEATVAPTETKAPTKARRAFRYQSWVMPSMAAVAVVFACALFSPVFMSQNASRENARRAVTNTSNLKQIPPDSVAMTETETDRILKLQSPRYNSAAPVAGAGNDEYFSSSSSTSTTATKLAQQKRVSGEVQEGYKRKTVTAAAAPAGSASGLSSQSDASTLPSSLRRVHQEARITVAVAELEDKSNSVISLVKSSGGFIANNTLVTGADGLKSATLTVRVPVRRFETVLAEIGKLGDVKAKNISGEDITEQFSDAQQADIVLASELGVKESMLKAALLKAEKAEKAGKPIPMTWPLRTEVRRLRIEAAQTRARLELLKKISDLANIEVELREKPRTASEGSFAQQLSDTSRAAFDSFLLAARLPIMLLIWVLAYAPLWLPMLLIYRYATRVYQKKTTQT